jgi:hypothetical protein
LANITYLTGHAHWAKILGDPVPNFNKDGFEWTMDFSLNDETRAKMVELGLEAKIRNKDDDRGDFVQFKQKQFTSKGKRNDPPTVVDARNRPWDPNLKIGNGSLVEVKFDTVDYGKGKPKGVYLRGVRVLDHVPYVAQEFAPLPEDNEYFQKAPEPQVFEPAAVEDALDDPLNIEE